MNHEYVVIAYTIFQNNKPHKESNGIMTCKLLSFSSFTDIEADGVNTIEQEKECEKVTALGDNFQVKGSCARGSGAYGTVYQVLEKVTRRQFAAKVETTTVSLHREVAFLQKFNQASLLPVLEHHIVVGGFSYFVMPYVPVSLWGFIRGRGALDRISQQGLFQQMMNALGHIHQKGVLHADVKAGNILFDVERFHFYLIDFGLAVALPVDTHIRRHVAQ